MRQLNALALLLVICVLVVVLHSPTGASADDSTNDNSNNNSSVITTDPSICAMPYTSFKDLQFTVDTTTGSSSSASSNAKTQTTFLFSISPCQNTTIISPTNKVCGNGYAGWTEATQNASCMYLYTQYNTSALASAFSTIYSTNGGSEVLQVNWVCTGLDGDLNPNVKKITSVAGNRTWRTVTITTKGCKQADTGELRAGVIVAICVVAVFVLVVIVSVVKAKCFGSSGAGSSAHAAAHAAAISDGYQPAP